MTIFTHCRTSNFQRLLLFSRENQTGGIFGNCFGIEFDIDVSQFDHAEGAALLFGLRLDNDDFADDFADVIFGQRRSRRGCRSGCRSGFENRFGGQNFFHLAHCHRNTGKFDRVVGRSDKTGGRVSFGGDHAGGTDDVVTFGLIHELGNRIGSCFIQAVAGAGNGDALETCLIFPLHCYTR